MDPESSEMNMNLPKDFSGILIGFRVQSVISSGQMEFRHNITRNSAFAERVPGTSASV